MSPRSSYFIAVALLPLLFVLATQAAAQSNYAPPGASGGPVIVNNFPGTGSPSSDPYGNYVAPAGGWFPGANFNAGAFNAGAFNGQGFGIIPGPMSVADRLWVRAEYLYWFTEGMDLPPLVTRSPDGTPLSQSAVLGRSATTTLFGGDEINDGGTSGVRLRTGFWLTNQGTFAIEGEYFQLLGDRDDGFNAAGDGSPILGRPFFDSSRGLETAQLFSFPDRATGSVNVTSDSDLRSLLINGRASLCPVGVCNAYGESDRVDWIIGYRRIELDDSLTIVENLESTIPNARGTIASRDSFRTSNEFNALQLGITHQANFKRGWLESMLRVAVGNNTQSVEIAGSTSITENDETENYVGGILAQRSNIGSYERDQFTMVPELGLTLGIRLTDWLDATVGYSVLYLPSVVRAGDQISTDIDSNQFPPATDPAVSDNLRPRFDFIETDYWAHGLNVGAELRF